MNKCNLDQPIYNKPTWKAKCSHAYLFLSPTLLFKFLLGLSPPCDVSPTEARSGEGSLEDSFPRPKSFMSSPMRSHCYVDILLIVLGVISRIFLTLSPAQADAKAYFQNATLSAEGKVVYQPLLRSLAVWGNLTRAVASTLWQTSRDA